jgi:hypothetical protein
MKGIGTWLMALIGPLGKKLLVQLGFTFVTFTGLDLALGAMLAQAQAAWGSSGAAVAQIVAMSGANTAIAIICGAILARVIFVQAKRLVPH